MRYFHNSIASSATFVVDGFCAYPGEITAAVTELLQGKGDGGFPINTALLRQSRANIKKEFPRVYDDVLDIVYHGRFPDSFDHGFSSKEVELLTALRVFLQRCETQQSGDSRKQPGVFVLTNMNDDISLTFINEHIFNEDESKFSEGMEGDLSGALSAPSQSIPALDSLVKSTEFGDALDECIEHVVEAMAVISDDYWCQNEVFEALVDLDDKFNRQRITDAVEKLRLAIKLG